MDTTPTHRRPHTTFQQTVWHCTFPWTAFTSRVCYVTASTCPLCFLPAQNYAWMYLWQCQLSGCFCPVKTGHFWAAIPILDDWLVDCISMPILETFAGVQIFPRWFIFVTHLRWAWQSAITAGLPILQLLFMFMLHFENLSRVKCGMNVSDFAVCCMPRRLSRPGCVRSLTRCNV